MKIKNYLYSFWKYYILKKPKLILSIVLTVIVYLWISDIINSVPNQYLEHTILARSNEGIYFIFLKPVFVYISGLVLINKI